MSGKAYACGACLTSPFLCNLFLFYVNFFVPSCVHSYDVITTPDELAFTTEQI